MSLSDGIKEEARDFFILAKRPLEVLGGIYLGALHVLLVRSFVRPFQDSQGWFAMGQWISMGLLIPFLLLLSIFLLISRELRKSQVLKALIGISTFWVIWAVVGNPMSLGAVF